MPVLRTILGLSRRNGDVAKSEPTLKLVASAARVHVSTASRALDPAQRHLIGGDVRTRVEAAAQTLGYRRNAAAAALRTGRTQMVGVILPDIANPVFAPILAGVEAVIGRKGYSAVVANAGGSAARAMEAARQLAARRVEGIVLASAELDEAIVSYCRETGLPVVLVNRAEARARAPSVTSDDRAGMALSVGHLAGLGHRRIGHLAGPQTVSTGLWRLEGFRTAMAKRGLDATAVAVAGAYAREAGERTAAALLAAGGLTAIACANDLLALGALAALKATGLRCPADVSLVGYNDMPLIDSVDPPLTSVRINPERMGAVAGERLMRWIDEGDSGADGIVLEPTLVIRGSTAAPARRRP